MRGKRVCGSGERAEGRAARAPEYLSHTTDVIFLGQSTPLLTVSLEECSSCSLQTLSLLPVQLLTYEEVSCLGLRYRDLSRQRRVNN